MIPEPGLYIGTLRHRRFRPRSHAFTYNLFMAWLDIDRIPELMRQSRWTSVNRFNWASYDDRDHFGDPARSLRERVVGDARAQGVTVPDGPIYLLTHLRYLGYCFNPISFFFCYDRDGVLRAVLAEVSSTFGERCNYWLADHNRQPSLSHRRYRNAKAMHVSPFMEMTLDYEFVLSEPSGTLMAHMATLERDPGTTAAPLFDATLSLNHQVWTPRVIRTALLRHPWMTAKVIVAIHWQALRLYVKRVPVFTHPARVRPAAQEATKP